MRTTGAASNHKNACRPGPRVAILVTIDPQPGEREVVAAHLPEAVWAVDGIPDHVDGVLSLWPRSEFAALGLAWGDMPGLDWVKLITAGVNHIGWDEVPEQVDVMSTPGATGPIIAEYVLGAVIAWARGFVLNTADIRAGTFENGRPARAVAELKVGVVGHGGLGRHIADILHRHGATVRAVSRSGQGASAALERLDTMDGLPDLLAWADVLVLAVPLQRGTWGLIDADALRRFGDGLVINVARGPVLDQDAAYAWLAADAEHRFAHLDVWWDYPKRHGHPFQQPFHALPNVTMTPHNSPNVTGFRHVMIARACTDLVHMLATGERRHVEDRELYRLPAAGDGRR